jgi:hypothetical protein
MPRCCMRTRAWVVRGAGIVAPPIVPALLAGSHGVRMGAARLRG